MTGKANAIPVNRVSQDEREMARVAWQELVVFARGGKNRKGEKELVENLSDMRF